MFSRIGKKRIGGKKDYFLANVETKISFLILTKPVCRAERDNVKTIQSTFYEIGLRSEHL